MASAVTYGYLPNRRASPLLTGTKLYCLLTGGHKGVNNLPGLVTQPLHDRERLRNDLFCVEWDVKPELNQSVTTASRPRHRLIASSTPNPLTHYHVRVFRAL